MEIYELILNAYQLSLTNDPELNKVKAAHAKLYPLATGKGYNEVLKQMFDHEDVENDHGINILQWRIGASDCPTKSLLKLLESQFTKITNDVIPVKAEAVNDDKKYLDGLYNNYWQKRTMRQYVSDLVSNHALHSPFDWLLLDIEGAHDPKKELPKIKPVIISIDKIKHIGYECGNPISLTYSFENKEKKECIVYVDAKIYIELKKSDTKAISKDAFAEYNAKNELTFEEEVALELDSNQNYLVSFYKRDLGHLPATQLGYAPTDISKTYLGNPYVDHIELLNKFVRSDSNLSFFTDKFIRPEVIKVVQKDDDAKDSLMFSEKKPKKKSNMNVDEIEVTDLAGFASEAKIDLGSLRKVFDQPVVIYDKLDDYNKRAENKITRAICGVEVFDKTQIGVTATEKNLEYQSKKQGAKIRLEKEKQLINFIMETHLSFYRNYATRGIDKNTSFNFSFPQNISIQTTSDILEKFTEAKAAHLPSTVLDTLMEEYYMALHGGNLGLVKQEMFWLKINPFSYGDKEAMIAIDGMGEQEPIYPNWARRLNARLSYVRKKVELEKDGFYELGFSEAFEFVKQTTESL